MYQPKSSAVASNQLKVQRLIIPFTITANTTPASKSLNTDEPQILFLQTQGLSQIPAAIVGPIIIPPPSLGTAGNYAVLAGSTITNTGTTTINGNLGLSPGSSVTGAPTVTGTSDIANPAAVQAKLDRTAAYNNLVSLTSTGNLTGQDLGSVGTLAPGVYTYSSSAQLTGTLTLDAQNNPNAVWVFQIGTTLTTATASTVVILNGGSAANVFFAVGSSATIGTSTLLLGNVVAQVSITVNTSATVQGSLLAGSGAVTLDTNVVTKIMPPAGSSLFDLVPSDSQGAFNLMVNISPSEQPGTSFNLLYGGDRYYTFTSAEVISRTGGGSFRCYPNSFYARFDTTLTKLYLNCKSGVNLTTTNLDASLLVEYTTYE